LIATLEALAPTLREHVEDADRDARLPEAVVRALLGARLFRLWIPQRYGGFELDLPETLRVYEAAAAIDGSIGWAVMIGAGGGLFAARLDGPVAEEIYSPPDALIAGSGAPDGRAEQLAGGYRVTGRWRYASGADYATTFTANCIVTSNGHAISDSDGRPLIRAMAFEPSQVKVVRTWNASGMRGTGSHDFKVADVFVPQRRTFNVFSDPPREPGALYRLPFTVLTEFPVAAVALGIARHALEVFATLARAKRSAGSDAPLADDSTVRLQYAQSHTRWRFAHAHIHELAREAWHVALAGRSLDAREQAEITASCTLCVTDLCLAIGQLAALAGMSAILGGQEFARAWRDLQTLGAHISVSPRQFASAGGALLGGGEA
jgi:indole-3-acetate monooxygenase